LEFVLNDCTSIFVLFRKRSAVARRAGVTRRAAVAERMGVFVVGQSAAVNCARTVEMTRRVIRQQQVALQALLKLVQVSLG